MCLRKNRLEKTLDILSRLVQKIDECTPHIDAAFMFGFVHGQKYNGPQYRDIMDEAKAHLKELHDIRCNWKKITDNNRIPDDDLSNEFCQNKNRPENDSPIYLGDSEGYAGQDYGFGGSDYSAYDSGMGGPQSW